MEQLVKYKNRNRLPKEVVESASLKKHMDVALEDMVYLQT